jgi:hypothetical protein
LQPGLGGIAGEAVAKEMGQLEQSRQISGQRTTREGIPLAAILRLGGIDLPIVVIRDRCFLGQ